MLHGAERIFPRKENSKVSNKAGTNKSGRQYKETTNTSSHAAVSDVHDIESSKGLLPIATLGVPSDVTSLLTLVLCDSASTHSWLSSSLVNRLGLVGEPVNLSISGFNSTTVVETQRVKFTVSSEPNKTGFVFFFCVYVKDNIRIGSELINIADLQNRYPQLAPIKPNQYTYEDVEVIIGQDYYHVVKPIEFILGDDKNSPCSVRLPIGWVISGPLPPSVNSTSSYFKCVVEDSSLTDQIESWYQLELYGAFKQVDARSAADKHALSILNSETVHNGERYIVPMLWIDSNVSLPNNYYSSLVQFKTLERRLIKDTELRERYAETIREDVRKGYVVTVEPHNPRKRSDREWYLPHHPFVNPNKPGKVRRVLNGASKFHGTSLNKSLLVGLDLLQNLTFVLLRFRQHKYAVSADIEGMFLQVGVLARDQILLRFLWREDTTSDVVVYQYTRHIIGARDSPTCANSALRKTDTDNMSTYPEAASVVNEKFYMDDYLDSFENVTHAIKISRDLVSLLKLGGFKLTKFVSNADEITSAMNPEESETSSSPIKEICNGAQQSSHVLGLKWDHLKDILVVSRGVDRPLDKAITQRTVLSFVSSVFDPVGLVASYTIRARLLLKDIWKISGQSWDDELPEDIRDKFLEWHSGLPLLG